jgi:hypothetical protein
MAIIIESQVIQQQDRQLQRISVRRLVQQRLQLDQRHHRRHVQRLVPHHRQLDLRHHRQHVQRLVPYHRQLDLLHHRQLDLYLHQKHVLQHQQLVQQHRYHVRRQQQNHQIRLQDQLIHAALQISQILGSHCREIDRIKRIDIAKEPVHLINWLFCYNRIPGGSNSL